MTASLFQCCLHVLNVHFIFPGIHGWVPERQRQSLVWNRTVNMSGNTGKCVEMDLVNELYNNSFKGMGSHIHCNRRLIFSGSKILCVKVCCYNGIYIFILCRSTVFGKLIETPHLETSHWHAIWIHSITRKLSNVQGLLLSRWEPQLYCLFSPITVGITLKFEITLMFYFVFVYTSHCMCWQAPWREVGELLARTLCYEPARWVQHLHLSSCHCTTRRWRVGKGCITTKAANMIILRRLWRWWRPWPPTACLVCTLEDTTGGSRGLCTQLPSPTLVCWRDLCSHTPKSWNGRVSNGSSSKMLAGQKIWVRRQLCLERWTQTQTQTPVKTKSTDDIVPLLLCPHADARTFVLSYCGNLYEAGQSPWILSWFRWITLCLRRQVFAFILRLVAGSWGYCFTLV